VAVLIGLYLAAGIAFLIAVNADEANGDIPFFALAAAALIVGWGTAKLGWRGLAVWVLMPGALVLLALPFGTTERYTGGECCVPVAASAVFAALASVVVMLVAAGGRALYERRRHSRL
jgi:hypothetical protein